MTTVAALPWGSAARDVCTLVAFRLLPVIAFAPGFAQTRLLRGTLAGVVLIAFACSGWNMRDAMIVVGAYAVYYAFGRWALDVLVRLQRLRVFTTLGLFGGIGVAVYLAPGIFLAGGVGRLAVIILGWEMVLKSYSYVVEAARHQPKWRQRAEFFLLANPLLVYSPNLPAASGASVRPGLRRMALGCVVTLGLGVFVSPFLAGNVGVAGAGPTSVAATGPWLTAATHTGLAMLLLYGQHSALASLQIGAMRVLGFVLPERYDRPFLARSPADFWRRWNTYLGAWLRRYVLEPVTVRVGRAGFAPSRAMAVGAVATFLVCGALHDIHALLSQMSVTLTGTFVLGTSGVITLGWIGLSRMLDGRVRFRLAGLRRVGLAAALVFGFWAPTAVLIRLWVRDG